MSTLTMAARSGEFLVNEFDPSYNREVVNIEAGQNLKPNTVLGRVTDGEYVQYDPAAVTGEEIAAGVLFGAVNATDAETRGAALTRGPATIKADALTFPEGTSDANKSIALTHLQHAGIVSL